MMYYADKEGVLDHTSLPFKLSETASTGLSISKYSII